MSFSLPDLRVPHNTSDLLAIPNSFRQKPIPHHKRIGIKSALDDDIPEWAQHRLKGSNKKLETANEHIDVAEAKVSPKNKLDDFGSTKCSFAETTRSFKVARKKKDRDVGSELVEKLLTSLKGLKCFILAENDRNLIEKKKAKMQSQVKKDRTSPRHADDQMNKTTGTCGFKNAVSMSSSFYQGDLTARERKTSSIHVPVSFKEEFDPDDLTKSQLEQYSGMTGRCFFNPFDKIKEGSGGDNKNSDLKKILEIAIKEILGLTNLLLSMKGALAEVHKLRKEVHTSKKDGIHLSKAHDLQAQKIVSLTSEVEELRIKTKVLSESEKSLIHELLDERRKLENARTDLRNAQENLQSLQTTSPRDSLPGSPRRDGQSQVVAKGGGKQESEALLRSRLSRLLNRNATLQKQSSLLERQRQRSAVEAHVLKEELKALYVSWLGKGGVQVQKDEDLELKYEEAEVYKIESSSEYVPWYKRNEQVIDFLSKIIAGKGLFCSELLKDSKMIRNDRERDECTNAMAEEFVQASKRLQDANGAFGLVSSVITQDRIEDALKVFVRGKEILNCERVLLWIVDQEHQVIWTRAETHRGQFVTLRQSMIQDLSKKRNSEISNDENSGKPSPKFCPHTVPEPIPGENEADLKEAENDNNSSKKKRSS